MTKASTSTSTEKGKERTGHWFGGGIWKAIARGDKLEWFHFILFSQLLFARSLTRSLLPSHRCCTAVWCFFFLFRLRFYFHSFVRSLYLYLSVYLSAWLSLSRRGACMLSEFLWVCCVFYCCLLLNLNGYIHGWNVIEDIYSVAVAAAAVAAIAFKSLSTIHMLSIYVMLSYCTLIFSLPPLSMHM